MPDGIRKLAAAAVISLLTAGSAAAERKAPTEESYPWLGNTLGISTAVPAPWTPVEVDGGTIRVWGREIRYDESLMPVQITSQGVGLLARPIALVVGAGGRHVAIGPVETEIISARQDRVVLRAVAEAGEVRCQTLSTIEFDGMVKIELTLMPRAAVGIDKLQVIVPIRKEVSEVYGRYLEYDFTELRADKMSFTTCTRHIREPVHLPFNPEIWLGNRQVGLTWAAETNCQWEQEHPGRALSVLPGEASTDLVMNVVDHPTMLAEPKTIEFALFATPLKPIDPRMRQIRLAAFGRIYNAFKAGVSRDTYDYYAIASHGEVQAAHTSLPRSLKNEQHLRVRRQYSEHAVKYIPYGALWYTNAVMDAGRSGHRGIPPDGR